MELEIEVFVRGNGALIAQAPNASAPPLKNFKLLGVCRLPEKCFTRGFVSAFARDGRTVAAGSDRALLRAIGKAVSYRSEHVPGASLFETAIRLACCGETSGARACCVVDA